jgi:hypothetical protein
VIDSYGSDEDREDWERYAASSVYQAIVQSAIGRVGGPGAFFVGYELRTPSGVRMSRILAVRMLIQYYSEAPGASAATPAGSSHQGRRRSGSTGTNGLKRFSSAAR